MLSPCLAAPGGQQMLELLVRTSSCHCAGLLAQMGNLSNYLNWETMYFVIFLHAFIIITSMLALEH